MAPYLLVNMKLVLVLIYSSSKDSRNKTQVELIFYKGGFLYLPTTPDPTRPVSRWHLLAKLSPGWPRTPTTSRTTRWPPPSSTSTSRRVGLLYLVFMFIIKVDFFAEDPKNLQLRFFFGRVEASSKKTFKTFSWCCWFSFRLNYFVAAWPVYRGLDPVRWLIMIGCYKPSD